MTPQYTIHSNHHHHGWDRELASVLTLAPGDTAEFLTIDASGGQLTVNSNSTDVAELDFEKVNPVTGPIAIEGAQPGDVLKVKIESFTTSGWGWTAIIPGFGLLADQFPEPAINIWTYDRSGDIPSAYGPGGRVPLKPFCGTIGLAPEQSGRHSIVPPRRIGGNMDIRDLAAGTVLYLPIEVSEGLFSVGDTHAAQGDGEVCGTALESQMNVVLTFDLLKEEELVFPRYETPGPVSRHLDSNGYLVTTGIGPDLMRGARDAVSGMIDLLSREQGFSPAEAYMLCSVCADLRINEIVDQPNWVVSLYFPKIVLC